MKKELDEYLVKTYPKIFRDRHADMRTTCMCWGFEHGDGWFTILDGLSYTIQSHIDQNRSLIRDAIKWNKMVEAGEKPSWWYYSYPPKPKEVPDKIPQVIATQVKEKFGVLRFYYSGGDSVIEDYVTAAAYQSMVTCETCGKGPAKVLSGGWIMVRCLDCARIEGRQEEFLEING